MNKFQTLGLLIFMFNASRMTAQVTADTNLVNIKEYNLGEVVITGRMDKETVTSSEITIYNKPDVASALNILPSIVLSNTGSRNEGTIYLRGFDIRSVPIYADGIPVYVPYDGYVDLSRFTTADLSKIEVSKGYSSILYGPNAIGGTINLISSKPKDKIEVTAKAGIMSGNGYDTYLNIGSNLGKIYLQGNISKLKRDYYPLSKDFDSTKYQAGLKRDNSYRDDTKASFKVGYVPNKTDEYSINYIYQHGEKGNPVYVGEDSKIKVRFWQWPYWDKESIYFISRTRLATKSYVKTRLFYDRFKNQIDSYDDNTYTTQNKPSSFTSLYNDETYGINLEAGTETLKNNDLKVAVHFKNDNHRENNVGEPVRHMSDNTISVGVEDIYTPTPKLSVIPGISYNMRESLQAQNYDSKNDTITDFPANHDAAPNLQLASYYTISEKVKMNFNISYKSRFATMKDRYSYKMGTAIPNPDLNAEAAMNYELASSIAVFENLSLQPSLFYSKLNNTIQSVSNVEPGVSQMQNTGRAEYLGADLSLVYYPLKDLRFYATYTYIERHNLTNPDILFTDVPNNKVFSSIEYKFLKSLDAVVFGEYNTRRYSTSYGTVSPEYFLLNAQVSYTFAKYFKIEAGVNNIFDTNYTISEGYPEEGRNFYTSLLVNFHK